MTEEALGGPAGSLLRVQRAKDDAKLILLTLFLTGCLDDINLNQGKKAELKEIKGTTYFIST